MSLKSTLLVMTLNEFDAIRQIMPRINRQWVDQILVVDGGSNDGTVAWAKGKGYEVLVCSDVGLTHAYTQAWDKIRGDIVVYFSPDGNSIPEVIPLLLNKIKEGYDMVVASRYLKGAKSYDDDLLTAFGNWFFRTLINFLLRPKGGMKITDPLVMFRAHSKDLPKRLGIPTPEPLDKYLRIKSCWLPLMSMRALSRRLRFAEIPADEPPRIGGKRKLKVWRYGLLHLLQLFREWYRKN